jgi:hypothetical protein
MGVLMLAGQKSQAAAPKTPPIATRATHIREIHELGGEATGGVMGCFFFSLMLAQ